MAGSVPNRIRYTGPRNPWRAITREKIIDWLRTLAWVVPLTLLVWIWAERQQLVRTPNAVAIPITLRASSADVVVHMISPADGNVMAVLSGPQNSVDKVLTLISNPNSDERVYINVDTNVSPGRHEISTTQIGESPIFTGRGVSVLNAAPVQLIYSVEKIVDANMPVEMPPDVMNLDGTPAFDPPTVKFRGPQSVLDQLTADRQLVVYANLKGRDALHIPGAHEEIGVPLILPSDASDVTFTPGVVKATFQVRATEERFVYPSMPVWVLAPPVLAERGFKVSIVSNTNLANVTLVGSPDVIAQLRSDTLTPKPRAHVEVSLDDLPAGTLRTRQVEFDLPEGVHVAAEDQARTVDFKLVDITAKE
jgi:hypothetical protein